MGRMVEALKILEHRSTEVPAIAPAPVAPAAKPPAAAPIEPTAPPELPPVAAMAPPAGTDSISRLIVPCVPRSCKLPTAVDVDDPYFELAERISDQLAANYCNVVLFATPDRFSEPRFSLTHLAQAMSLQSPGDVLLVDGDLLGRKLSKSVCPGSPGLIDVMVGTAHWPDVVHTTNVACIDFVSCGQGALPTLERSQFGWEALRPQYRAVLIGLAEASRPETDWLAARCDAVYLVLSRRHTHRQTASAATSSLRASGANLAGCVVTDD